MIHVTIEQAGGDTLTWLIPTLAGLIGALIGGAASLWASRSSNQHAVRLLRLERREESADAVLARLWRAINTRPEERTVPTAAASGVTRVQIEVDFDRKALLANVYDLGNRSAGDEPLVEQLCHDFAWKAGYGCAWEEFRRWSAALSAGLTRWRKNPVAFRREAMSLEDHLATMPEAMAIRDEAKVAGAPNPSESDSPPLRRAPE